MQRRDFIKLSAAMGAASALPLWSRSLMAEQARPALPIPALLTPDPRGMINIVAQQGQTQWLGKSVTTWGYNGNLLGPAIQLECGKPVTLNLHNNLPEATTVHWHGLALPGDVDGGPQALIAPGKFRSVSFTPDQPGATCWFHPHQHGRTGYQVAQGLAGLVILKDDATGKLLLPKIWGVDDIPVILQDKRLSKNSSKIDYELDVMSAAVGWFGNTMLTNGAIYPLQAVPRGWLRLRLLNGCNARTLNLATSDHRPMYVIGSDGGLLSEPVKLSELSMMPGERFEVLVDTHDGKTFDLQTMPVRQMGMTLAPFDQPLPLLTIQPLQILASGSLPDKLVDMPALPAQDGAKERWLQLMMDPELERRGMLALMEKYGRAAMAGMSSDAHDNDGDDLSAAGGKMDHGSMAGMDNSSMTGMDNDSMAGMDNSSMPGMTHTSPVQKSYDFHNGNKINGIAFDMKTPSFDVKQGMVEKWTISGEGDEMLHPFHIHGTQFRILSENGKPPAPHRSGWKDMVRVEGWRSEVLVRFNHLAVKEQAYMAHCHLLEHEDTGMMLGFTVSA